MSDKIKKKFIELKHKKRPAFISYITAGDPDYGTCLQIVDSLVTAGIDILELGVPFSDPLADGEANQLSAQRALSSRMTVGKVLSLVKDIRMKHAELPIVLYSYLNPVAFANDFKTFCREACSAGVDSLLLLDLTPEEGRDYKRIIENSGMTIVALVAPNTPEQRFDIITEFASSFIYYVTREGVTGTRTDFASDVETKIRKIKEHTELPVVMGFGISTPDHVKSAKNTGTDGIVVGSAIVKKVESYCNCEADLNNIEDFVKSLTGILKN